MILHLATPAAITKNFFLFLEENLDCSGNFLLSASNPAAWPSLKIVKNVSSEKSIWWFVNFLSHANRAEKIIIHGLWESRVLLMLVLNPWLLKRCYWVIWGADLYSYKSKKKSMRSNFVEALRRFVIRRMGFMVTFVEGDVNLARKWYGATGRYLECFMYTSNVFRHPNDSAENDSAVHIQVGNSADPSNNHLEIFDQLMEYRDQNIFIYAPLSYGDAKNAQAIEEEGFRRFGEKFVALKELMPIEAYLKFLGKMDVAIFNHKRQQGMGNTISLLGMGKKVYLNPEVTPWDTFKSIGIEIFDSREVSLEPMTSDQKKSNREAVERNFSEKKLISQLRDVLKG